MGISIELVRIYAEKVWDAFVFLIFSFQCLAKKRKAFTLAEVLVALTIIGVVSALAVSTLSANILLSENKSKIKKADSTIAQAVLMLATNHNGTIAGLGAGNSTFRNAMEPYLSSLQQCDNGAGNCFPSSINNLDGSNLLSYTDNASLLLANGAAISMNYDQTCSGPQIGGVNTCGTIIVDTNAKAQPNSWGNDVYGLWILPNTVMPFGSSTDTIYPQYTCYSNGQGCAFSYVYDFTAQQACDTTTVGQVCGAGTPMAGMTYAGTCTQISNSTVLNGESQTEGEFIAGGQLAHDTSCIGNNEYLAPLSTEVGTSVSWATLDSEFNEIYPAYGTCNDGIAGHTQGTTTGTVCQDRYKEAEDYCASLGDQLPSMEELNSLYANQTSLNLNTVHAYWSSSVNGPFYYSWVQRFSNGLQLGTMDFNTCLVRCVKSSG